jgi:hypothetical protein
MGTIIFGYGSLLNPKSVWKTAPQAKVLGWATLRGYQRKTNAICERFPDVAMNIVENDKMSIEGILLEINEDDMPAVLDRETGYEMVEVTDQINPDTDSTVYTFVAPDVHHCSDKKMCKDYLDICLDGVPEEKRAQWLADTIFACPFTTTPREELYRDLAK